MRAEGGETYLVGCLFVREVISSVVDLKVFEG